MEIYKRKIRAVIFDMDGTLIDSESCTDRCIDGLLSERQIEHDGLDYVQFHGVTWKKLEGQLKELFPALEQVAVDEELAQRFIEMIQDQPPALIRGARQAFVEAGGCLPTAIATGSDSAAVEDLLDRAELRAVCRTYTSCEMYSRSKPDPECFLLTAKKLGVDPAHCLVFEDSRPGLQAAAAAGMGAIAINPLQKEAIEEHPLALMGIRDYTCLPADFFVSIR